MKKLRKTMIQTNDTVKQVIDMDENSEKILPYDKIPFGHWGIINRYNLMEEILNEYKQECSAEEFEKISHLNLEELIKFIENKKTEGETILSRVIRKIPKKRWDFTCSSEIRLDSNGNKIILPDKYAGRFALISAVRDIRPKEYSEKDETVKKEEIKAQSEISDIFAPIIEGKDYAIIVSKDEIEADNPFSISPKMENLSMHSAITLINRFPAYARIIDKEIKPYLKSKINNSYTKLSSGINLVTIPIKYYEKIEEASIEDLHAIFESMRTALNYVRKEATNRGINYVPVYPFFNIGKKVGGSLRRLHAQAYIDLNQDGHGGTMEDLLKAFDEQSKKHKCKFCNLPNHELKDYLIYENDLFVVYATRAPIRNYDTKIIPKRHIEDMLMINHQECLALSEALKKVSQALNVVGADVDRNILIYQRPFGYDSFFHMFFQILPFENVGGIEMMDESRVVRIDPANFAEEMRKAIEKI